MGWKRVGLPAATALLLLVAPWIAWWTLSLRDASLDVDFSFRMSLADTTACALDRCAPSEAPGVWSVVCGIALVIVLATAVASGALAVRLLSERDPGVIPRLLRAGCLATLIAIAVALAYAVLKFDGV